MRCLTFHLFQIQTWKSKKKRESLSKTRRISNLKNRMKVTLNLKMAKLRIERYKSIIPQAVHISYKSPLIRTSTIKSRKAFPNNLLLSTWINQFYPLSPLKDTFQSWPIVHRKSEFRMQWWQNLVLMLKAVSLQDRMDMSNKWVATTKEGVHLLCKRSKTRIKMGSDERRSGQEWINYLYN